MKNQSVIIFCVEKGLLEQQSRLLVSSVRRFLGSSVSLIAFSPRHDYLPSHDTESFFEKNQVLHIKDNINKDYHDYPIANKVLVCEYIEKHFPELETVIFVDTDTIFLNAPDIKYFSDNPGLFLRPVDNKGPGSSGPNDENDLFWQKVYDLFKMELPAPIINTTVRINTIRPYYNAGLIWCHKLAGFFQQWKEDFEKLFNSGLRPYGYLSRDKTDFRCLDQVALAVTAQRFEKYLSILPEPYNYPIPFRPILKDRDGHPRFDELVHVHYHRWFQHPDFLDHVTNKEEKKSEQYLWLKQHLPLFPVIDDPFKC